MQRFFGNVEALATAVECWCREHRVRPASGQASSEITPRNVRFYRTRGLLDGPSGVGATAYGEKHYLQLIAIRILQAKGLPLARIQQLLLGRTIEELRRVQREGAAELAAFAAAPLAPEPPAAETWQVSAVDDEWLLVSRRARVPSLEQLTEIRRALAASPRTITSSK